MRTKSMDDFLLEKFNEIEKIHWWWEGRRELIKGLLGGLEYKRILDVGCGSGETLSFLKTLFPKAELYGIDTSQKATQFSKKRGHKNIFKANALNLPFKNGFFDLVLILDVIEHIEDDAGVVKEAARVLRKKGKIIITSPALPFIWSGHDTNQGHERRYTRRRFRMLAKKAGLKVDFISYFNFLFSLPIISMRLLSRLKPLRSLSNYDNSVNFDVAHVSLINELLKFLFTSEVRMVKYFKYPLGISVVAKLSVP